MRAAEYEGTDIGIGFGDDKVGRWLFDEEEEPVSLMSRGCRMKGLAAELDDWVSANSCATYERKIQNSWEKN